MNATLGIISACSGEWRTWRGGRLDHYIRLDLTLYPGSDGGAVVNTAGETIGIATSALSRIAGLAIPAVTIDRVVDEILTRGHVARGYLGVGLQPVELPDHQKGLIVLSLEPEGPAAKAGVLIGDILVTLGGNRGGRYGRYPSRAGRPRGGPEGGGGGAARRRVAAGGSGDRGAAPEELTCGDSERSRNA